MPERTTSTRLLALLALLPLLSGCHFTVQASDSGMTAPAGLVRAQQPEVDEEQMSVLSALGAEMAREKFPRLIVVRGSFTGSDERCQGPCPARFEPMRPVEPAIMSYALAAGALVDVSPRERSQWVNAYFNGPGRDEVNPGEPEPPVAMFHQLLDPPLIRGDSAFVEVRERVLRAGRPAEALFEGWRYTLRRQSPRHPWIVANRALVWAQ